MNSRLVIIINKASKIAVNLSQGLALVLEPGLNVRSQFLNIVEVVIQKSASEHVQDAILLSLSNHHLLPYIWHQTEGKSPGKLKADDLRFEKMWRSCEKR